MHFFASKYAPFDLTIEVPTLKPLKGSLDYDVEHVKVYAGDEEAILLVG